MSSHRLAWLVNLAVRVCPDSGSELVLGFLEVCLDSGSELVLSLMHSLADHVVIGLA